MPRSVTTLSLLLVGCAAAPAPVERAASPAPPITPTTPEPTAPSASSIIFVEAPPPAKAVASSGGRFVTPTSEQIRARGMTRRLMDRPGPLLKKKWTHKIGKTTFRSTIGFDVNTIVVGTHGATWEGKNEASDGVYVLEARTGKLLRLITPPGTGDRDVGGIALDGPAVIFGTDNGQVVKATLSTGAPVWTASLAGKARPAPALANLDGHGALDVVVGDEAGDLHAIDGDTGKHLWLRSTGVNDYDARGFIAAAAIADLNGDEVDDVIAGARDGILVAYDGRSGNELWRDNGGSGIHASPSLLDIDGDGRLEVLAAWSYSRLALFDAASGTLRYEQSLEQDRAGIEGLFASPIPLPSAQGAGVFVQGTSWWGGHRATAKREDTVDGVIFAAQQGRAFRSDEGRVTASAVVMDLGDDGTWDAILGTEDRDLLSLGADGTRRVLAKLNGAVEATAAAHDVDGDGTYELLVASNDGSLSCFETGSRTKPLISRFRGETNDNRGELGSIALRFVAEER